MIVFYFLGIVFRIMTYYTVKRHDWFAKEFEKRVQKFIEDETPGQSGSYSFYSLTKRMLEKTYYEIFEVRDRLSRRRNDRIITLSDRIFLIKQGMAWLVKDLLSQLKFLRWNDQNPKLINITKNTFQKNPCFNYIFGFFSVNRIHDILQILPSLFVIGGIFGTFLGIVKGLPALGKMDLSNMDISKQIMDQFLLEISFAMNSSIVGIFFSVSMTFINTLYSPDRVFVDVVDRFESSLDLLWYRSNNNLYPVDEGKFDEHRDPSEALAEQAITQVLKQNERSRDFDKIKSA
ncbi:MAG: hypothetical protein K1X29_00780 [Bdellovibrionales bacterium]|nr:hypothetical protein [Bdellovibrionales bacterium]